MMTWSSDWLNTGQGRLPVATAWTLSELAVPIVDTAAYDIDDSENGVPTPEDIAAMLEAEREAERVAAYEHGYAEGSAAGRAEAAARLSAAMTALEAATAQVLQRQAVPDELLEEHVLAVSLAVARHIIAREVRGDQQVIVDLVRRALTHFPLDEAVRIRVNPQDLSTISTVSSDDGAVRIAPGRNVQWIADTQLQYGECIVEGRQRIVDGRIDRALERIYNQLIHA